MLFQEPDDLRVLKNSLKKKIALSLFSLASILLLFEMVCWLLPVNEFRFTQDVNQQSPVIAFKKNTSGFYSLGAFLENSNYVTINNYGFVSDINYDSASPEPKIAVIGDSYIEALTVTWSDTIQGKLNKELETHSTYSFGISGAPLSQYLAFARFAKEKFSPEAYVFLIISNDFDESFKEIKNAAGFHYFTDPLDNEDPLELVPHSYSPSIPKRFAQQSRLACYLLKNLQLKSRLGDLFLRGGGISQIDNQEQRVAISNRATDYFLKLLPQMTEKDPSSVFLIVDAERARIYGHLSGKKLTYFEQVRSYFIDQAEGAGYNIIDLQEAFAEHYASDKKMFNFENDYHWNSLGHEVATEKLILKLRSKIN